MDLLVFMLTIVLSSNVVEATTIEDSKLLLQDLFRNYTKDIRPVEDQSKPVTVNIDLDIASINGFNEVAGTISMVVILYITWNDESLVWNPFSYGNTKSLTFPQSEVWVPEMFLGNPADLFEPITGDHFNVLLMANGDISWAPGALVTATCTPDVYKYPFDQQTCALQLTPWGYSSQQVKLKIPSSTILFTYFKMNSEWDVKASRTILWSGSFDMAYFSIIIERRHMNFMVSVVIPVIMLAFVNLLVFILPFNSGERASYSISVLLAFTVYMTVVSDRMPSSSQPMSYISYYLLSFVGISVTIVILNIFQIRTYSKHDNDEPVPEWVREAYLYTQNMFRRKKVDTSEQIDRPAGTNYSYGADNTGTQVTDSIGRNELFYTGILHESQVKEKPTSTTNNIPVISPKEPEKVTWHMAAKIADKFYFSLFLFLIVITTGSYFINTSVN